MKKSSSITKQEAIARLMKLCSRAEKSSFEIELKLKTWGLQHQSEEIVNLLRKENFLNDGRFVKAFVHDKIIINKWGRIKIKYYLLKSRIPGDIIEKELNSIDIQKYHKIITEELNRKKLSLNNLPSRRQKAKLFAFGNQRGYEMEYIRDFIEESD